MLVTMVVDGEDAKLERITKGGGFEKLEGGFRSLGLDAQLILNGIGENTPDDRWITNFNGKVDGKKMVADGAIRLQDGSVLRQCQMALIMRGSLSAQSDAKK